MLHLFEMVELAVVDRIAARYFGGKDHRDPPIHGGRTARKGCIQFC